MKPKSEPHRQAMPCEAERPDDGVPSTVLAKQERYRKKPNDVRAEQLCRQAMIALEASIACDCDAPELEDAEVLDVAPGRGIHMLVVTVAIGDGSPVAINAAHAALGAHLGRLRAGIAAAIHRKRVPTLRFVVVARDERKRGTPPTRGAPSYRSKQGSA